MGLGTLLTSIIGTISGGVTIIDALEKKFGKQSIEVQLYRVLDEALKELCEQNKWEHDPDAIGAFFRSNQIKTEAVSDEEQLIEILEVAIGVPELITAELKEEWIDCFDRQLSTYPDLYRYLNIRSKPQKITNPVIPESLNDIPAPIELLGREQAVSEIRNKLRSSRIVCIHADGGVGKTAVAAVVMDRIREEVLAGSDEFKHFAWIISQGDLKNDLAALNIPTAKVLHTDEEKLDNVKAFLQTYPTFLVIDNMDTLLDSVDLGLLNTIREKTKVLITSRIRQEGISGYKLKELDPDTALVFFYNCYLGNSDHSLEDLKAREDVEFVQKITKAATYNALFIELIGKTARWEYRKGLSYLWKDLKDNIFNASSKTDLENVEHRFSHGLSESDLKLQDQIGKLYALSKLPKKCQEIMNFMAQFPPEISIFDDLLDWAGFDINDLKWLTERAWIEQAEEGYLLHTMVNGSVRKQDIGFDIWKYENLINQLSNKKNYMPITAGYEAVRKWLNTAVILSDSMIDSIDEKYKNIGENQKTLHSAGAFIYNIAVMYKAQGNNEEALKYCQKALEIREKVLGTEHPDTATTYNILALVYQDQGNYEEALQYHLMALEIREKVLGKDHPDTGTTYNNLAMVYQNQGYFEESLKYFQKAMEIREKVLGKDHPDTGMTYNSLAVVYYAQGNYEDALKYNQKALEIREKVLGKDHPDTGVTYNNLAGVYQAQGNYEESLKYYQKALEIREKVLGKDHFDTALIYSNLAGLCKDQGNYEDALKYNQKALEINEKVLGKDHLYTGTTYNNLAMVYHDQGNYEEALKYFQKALEISEKVLGKDHFDTGMIYNNLAGVYYAQGNYEDALKYYQKALQIREKVLGKDHPDTGVTYNNLGILFYYMNRYEESMKYLRTALSIWKKNLRPDHPYTKMASDSLVYVEKMIRKQQS